MSANLIERLRDQGRLTQREGLGALLATAEEAAAEIERLQLERARYLGALSEIAGGIVPPDQHGHYLAHRKAVATARRALKP